MQCTTIGAFTSSYKKTSCGVCQGSGLGSLVCLVYINDIIQDSIFSYYLICWWYSCCSKNCQPQTM